MNSLFTAPAARCQRSSISLATTQIRHATMIRRPKRPYTFTQLITLSDGSTFTHRTTSPQPIYRTTKDTKNSPLWNPSSEKLLNVEEDEAGRLRKFRERFGRGFDAEAKEIDVDAAEAAEAKEEIIEEEEPTDNLMDLISHYAPAESNKPQKEHAKPSKGRKK